MEKFIEDAKRSAGYIFSEEPFKSNRKAFNVRAVKSASKDSGTDIPGQGIWKNTVVNSNFYTFGIERYMTTLDYKSVCDVASNAHYDQIYILVNTDKYGGGGMYNMYAISAADNEDPGQLSSMNSVTPSADWQMSTSIRQLPTTTFLIWRWNPGIPT